MCPYCQSWELDLDEEGEQVLCHECGRDITFCFEHMESEVFYV